MPYQIRELPAFTHPGTGLPVGLGLVYIGTEDTDPTVLGNRVNVTVTQEDGTEVVIAPASQPLTLNAAGQIQYQGSPVLVQAPSNYSLELQTSTGAQVYYLPYGFPQQTSALLLPATTAPSTVSDAGHVYTKLVLGVPELFYQDDEGNEVQLTSGGEIAYPGDLESGTRMAFFQNAAPEGWTQVTDFNDYMIRIVSGVGGGSGGDDSPINLEPDLSHTHETGDYTLNPSQIPELEGQVRANGLFGNTGSFDPNDTRVLAAEAASGPRNIDVEAVNVNIGSASPHNHGSTGSADPSFTFTPKYLEFIICEKD